MAINKRHFETGPSKYRGPGYRIDDTSKDGSGLVVDDGDGKEWTRGVMPDGIEPPTERREANRPTQMPEVNHFTIRGGRVRGG
jgi:hypothetical protein